MTGSRDNRATMTHVLLLAPWAGLPGFREIANAHPQACAAGPRGGSGGSSRSGLGGLASSVGRGCPEPPASRPHSLLALRMPMAGDMR